MNKTQAIEQVQGATTPAMLFGRDATQDEARTLYRELARILHPDAGGSDELFATLQSLWDLAQEQFAAKTYGKDSKLVGKEHTYWLGEVVAKGDIANLYRVSYDGRTALAKIPRQAKRSALIGNEVRALRRLDKAEDKYRPYAPKLLDALRYKDERSKAIRSVAILQPLDGFYSLTEVRDAYPIGIDTRDMAWMFRRLLVALGWAHNNGLIHGAVTPDHVMIHPEKHGLVLIDWTLAKDGGKLTLRPKGWADIYPEELQRTQVLDIHCAASTMEYLLRDTSPRQMRAFLNGCRIGAVPHAWKLKDEFDELLERLYGPRKFHPFSMPARTS